MIESGWIFLGRMAFVWTLFVIAASVYIDEGDSDTPIILGAVIGVIQWGIWAFASLSVETASSGVVFEFASPPLLAVGIAMLAVNGYLAIEGAGSAIAQWGDTEPKDF